MAQRDFETADKILDRAIAVDPQPIGAHAMKSALAVAWKGDVGFAENQLSSVPPGFDPEGLVTSARIWVLTLQRKFAEALQVLEQFRGETLMVPDRGPCPKAALQGSLYFHLGEKEKAHAAFEQARIVAERLVRDAPDNPGRHSDLGAVLAGLGQKEDAIKEGKKAVELLPESEDAFDGPQATAALAEIYTWVGEPDEALRLLDHLLTVPSGLSVWMLKLDPAWDPLRKDPRFQALIDKYAAKP
jgi:serine/threonine-protein kinase